MSLIEPDLEIRAARRTGYSDGYHGYPANTGDWPARESAAYHEAFRAGRADAQSGAW